MNWVQAVHIIQRNPQAYWRNPIGRARAHAGTSSGTGVGTLMRLQLRAHRADVESLVIFPGLGAPRPRRSTATAPPTNRRQVDVTPTVDLAATIRAATRSAHESACAARRAAYALADAIDPPARPWTTVGRHGGVTTWR